MMNISAEKKKSFTGHTNSVYALAPGFSPGTVLSGSGDKFVASWNVEKGEPEKFSAQFPSPVFSLCTLKKKNILLAGTGAGSVHLIDVEEKKELKILQLHNAQVFDLVYSPKHNLLLSAGGDGQLGICETGSFSLLKIKKISEGKVRSIALSPDEHSAAVTTGEGNIIIFDLPGMEERFSFPAHNLSANIVAWHPGGDYLLSGGRDAYLKAWDPKNNFELITSIPAHNFAIYDIALSPNEKLFATASRDKTIKIWDAAKIEFLLRISRENSGGHVNSVNKLLWDDVTQLLISAGDDRSVAVWEILEK